jgi:hypothetical protein
MSEVLVYAACMKWLALACGLVALSSCPALSQRLVDDSAITSSRNGPVGGLVQAYVDGQKRVCFYRSGTTDERLQSIVISELEACPVKLPFFDPNSPAPASASLDASSVDGGKRYCTYAQGVGHWTFAVSLSDYCPLAAGMAAQLAERARNNSK